MSKDAYAVSAPVYDLLIASFRPGQVAALERLIPLVRAESGPVLDIGAGSGLNTVFVLERLPDVHVYALEPSTAMRALTPRGVEDRHLVAEIGQGGAGRGPGKGEHFNQELRG